VVVLGSAAGGGLRPWSCACPSCEAQRREGGRAKSRSQDSLAVSGDGQRWFLLNVSPDVMRQIEWNSALQPALAAAGGERGLCSGTGPIAGAVLTNADLEHSIGLLSLQQWAPFGLYATRETYAGLVLQSAVFRASSWQRPQVLYRELALDTFVPLRDVSGRRSGLSVCAFPVQGQVPLHMQTFVEPSDETNVGLIIRDDLTNTRVVYVPGAGSADGIAERARDASCLFFDGTCWSDDELGAGESTRAMAHLPVSGPAGSLQLLGKVPVPRRYYTHVNDSNPMLREGSAERRAVEAQGWSVAEDGLELYV
jgi:pyrroloquinoline quinone biosynthesis protein B